MRSTFLGAVIGAACVVSSSARAQDASISFVHGIPGLPSAVEVFANDSKLFSFDYAESKGPIDITAGSYKFDVKLAGNTVLTASPTLAAGKSYTVIAHLKETSGFQLSLFENDLSFTKSDQLRLAVHHTANAPAVDVLVRPTGTNQFAKLVSNLKNPSRAVAEVDARKYDVALTAAGNTRIAFGPATVELRRDQYVGVYAIGELGKPSFQLFIVSLFTGQRPAPATLSVIHGIPNLPAEVEIFADGNKLFAFGYGDVKGPLSLTPGRYRIEAKLNGQTVLSANPTLEAGISYSAIAHLQATTGNTLTLFRNNLDPAGANNARVSVRHTAQAPAVDLLGRATNTTSLGVLARNLSNPKQAELVLAAGSYDVALAPTGTTNLVIGPATVPFAAGNQYTVYAVGEVGKSSFRLIVQSFDLRPGLIGRIRGRSCGGQVTLSTLAPEFDAPFAIGLSGAPAHAFAFLHIGSSDQSLGSLKLPLDLSGAGLQGCFLYQNTTIVLPFQASGLGTASVELFVPSTVTGLNEIHFQWSFLQDSRPRLTNYATIETQ